MMKSENHQWVIKPEGKIYVISKYLSTDYLLITKAKIRSLYGKKKKKKEKQTIHSSLPLNQRIKFNLSISGTN